MRILLCNDDGHHALGIQTLAQSLASAGHDVTIVAPSEERSGQSHAMTFFRPVLVRSVSPGVFSVHGTPADCAAIALLDLFRETPPDLVVSGINHGLNVGWDVNYSGTVGAATEAALLGHKAIAISVDLDAARSADETRTAFERAAALVVDVVSRLPELEWAPFEVLNINHPGVAPKGIRVANCGGGSMYVPNMAPLEAQGMRYERTRVYMIGGNERRTVADESQDVNLVQKGYVTFSFLQARQNSTENSRKLEALTQSLGV